MMRSLLSSIINILLLCGTPADGFLATTPWSHSSSRTSTVGVWDSSDNSDLDWDVLQQRLYQLKLQHLELQYQRPPHGTTTTTPIEFVRACLHVLRHNHDPVPDAGWVCLLSSCCTQQWKQQLYSSVGAPICAPLSVVAASLGQAMARPDNQFALIVGETESETDSCYYLDFPTDIVQYDDNEAWVECQLRNVTTNQLLVITGWSLEKVQGSWRIASMDWQDFRDPFRPGIGREEWMRICG